MAAAGRAPPPRRGHSLPGELTTQILDTALGLRGVRIGSAARIPASGFDCSGFVRYVFAQHHIELPRTVAEQFAAGA